MWPKRRSPKPASGSPPHWNAARKSMVARARRLSRAPKPRTRRCASIRIKPWASPSAWGRSLAIWSHAGATATATDHDMETPFAHAEPLVETSKRFARRLLTIGENRLELLRVEAQEERERL